MPFAQRELIPPGTGAVTSIEFAIARGAGSRNESRPTTLFASNLQGAEVVDIQFRTLDPSNEWVNLFEDGTQIQLTATNNAEVINAPGVFRVVKGVTAGNCGVYLSTPAAPGV